MKLWMSGEIQADVYDLYRVTRKEIETKVNEKLSLQSLDTTFEKWAFIPIIRENDHPDYAEITEKNSRDKVLEFRLKIDRESFLTCDNDGRKRLIIESLLRSVTLMPKLGVSLRDCSRLRDVLERIV